MGRQIDITLSACETKQKPNLLLADTDGVLGFANETLRQAIVKPALGATQQLDGLRTQPHLFLQLSVHRRLRTLIAVHATLGKLPGVATVNTTTPQNLIVVITDHNSHVGAKAVAVNHAFFVFCLLQDRFPEVDQIVARD